jgi:probable phosphoglycerate mutase
MLGETVTVLVLRHGQSEWNAVRRWQGAADPPLTELGRSQARNTAARLALTGAPFHGPWASDLVRASETATIMGRQLGLGTVTVDERLREAHAGEWQGLTPDEIEREYPGWLDSHRRPPSFEPYDRVVTRALAAIRAIAAATLADVGAHAVPLVVAHSGLIRSVVRHLGTPDSRIPNLGGIWLSVGRALPIDDPVTDRHGDHIALRGPFDPGGIVVSGVDAPGEDPGDQADDADAHRGTER